MGLFDRPIFIAVTAMFAPSKRRRLQAEEQHRQETVAAEEQRRQEIVAAEKRRRQEAAEKLRRQEEDRCKQKAAAAEEHRRKAKEKRMFWEVAKITDSISGAFKGLSFCVLDSENALNIAENEFIEGAFAPFWDAVENATKALAQYHVNAEGIRKVLRDYDEQNRHSPSRLPLTLPFEKFPDASPAVLRLSNIVRQAQKNFHFSSIYEQRKTNQILVAGFSSLGSAIHNIGGMITTSIRQLAADMNISLDNLLEATHSQTRVIGVGMIALSGQMSAESEAHREYEEKQLEQTSVDTEAQRKHEKTMLEKQDKQIELLDRIGKK